jgi:hypothetical protein
VPEREEFFKERIGEYLERNYEDSYGYAVEIDDEEEEITLYTSRGSSSEVPLIGSLVDELLEETGMEGYSFNADHDSSQI